MYVQNLSGKKKTLKRERARECAIKCTVLKSSRNKKDLNDVTAVLFSVCFLLLAAEKKTPKMGQL